MSMPGMSPQLASPPVRKTVLAHCQYTCLQGVPGPWTCPGCGTVVRGDEQNR